MKVHIKKLGTAMKAQQAINVLQREVDKLKNLKRLKEIQARLDKNRETK